MSRRLREAAAALVEHGRALGRAEYAKRVMLMTVRSSSRADRDGHTESAKHMIALGNEISTELTGHEKAAKDAAAAAEALMLAMEHPGAVLARRLVATYHGARAAWRGSR